MEATLYHYCSLETFTSIASNKCIRLSSLSLSNDSMEGRWTQERFADVSRSVWRGQTLETVLEQSALLPDLYGAFGFCLSSRHDKLSQWRGYADDGHGVCIGFRANMLSALGRNRRLLPHECKLTRIVYDLQEQEDLLRPVAMALQSTFSAYVQEAIHRSRTQTEISSRREIDKNLLSEPMRRDAIGKMGKKLPPILYRLKNPAFEEEEEWRLVSTYPIDQVSMYPTLGFHPRRSTISPYVALEFTKKPELIESVTLGPKNGTPVSVMKLFLDRLGLDAEVLTSKATYR